MHVDICHLALCLATSPLLEVGGRAHVALVHFPIALVAAALFFELVRLARRRTSPSPAALGCLALGLAGGLAAIASGWLHADAEGLSGSPAVEWHRWTAIVSIAAVLLTLGLALAGLKETAVSVRRLSVVFLVLAVALVSLAGHQGGELVWGKGYLLAPLKRAAAATDSLPVAPELSIEPSAGPVSFARDLAPIFAAACIECHGPDKQSGKLRLDTYQHLSASPYFDEIVVPGMPELSSLHERITLPQSHADFMPKRGVPLPAEHVELIRQWIEQGASPSASAIPARDHITHVVHEASLHTKPADPTQPWWHDATFYQIFVRSFADSTTGPLAGDGIGDLRGLIERLDYLNDGDPTTSTDLGVSGLWLLPINPSPSYHGYDVTDYRGVNPQYGTHEDLRELLAECHKRGIRVIIDLVINHCSSQHPWFLEAIDPNSDKHDWFVWRDEPLTGPGAPNHTVWHDRQKRRNNKVYYGFFYHGMPDFNLRSPSATAAIHDFSRYWLADIGIDGLRLDAIKHLIEDGVVFENTAETIAWLEDYRAAMHRAAPEAFLVGEIWASTEQVQRYIPGGVDSAFEFDIAFAIAEALNSAKAAPLAAALKKAYNAYGSGIYSTFIGNHDMDRVRSRLGNSIERARAAASIQFTMPGVPFIYYGEEIGMIGTKPDPDLRTPMQWTSEPEKAGFSNVNPWRAPNPDTPNVNVAVQTDDPQSLLSHYRTLIRLRQATPALAVGDFMLASASSPQVLAFTRTHQHQTVLVIINLSDQALEGVTIKPHDSVLACAGPLRDVLASATVNPRQGQDTWTPIASLAPYACHVIVCRSE
ncbi:MAG: DUF3459 domain-containing protein [Phycisphaeraceae bacterium]|nr:DUF3459 domain-containing protein [Phycisphaeraceae bacterium]MCW5763583.1 DUF3459 domain-containing protein [Phycisphaeraceae bacterium]